MNITDDVATTLHRDLCTTIGNQHEYRNNIVSALHGYSDGVEHALAALQLKEAFIPEAIDTVGKLEALPHQAVLLDENTNDIWQVNLDEDGSATGTWTAAPTKQQPSSTTTGRSSSSLPCRLPRRWIEPFIACRRCSPTRSPQTNNYRSRRAQPPYSHTCLRLCVRMAISPLPNRYKDRKHYG
ncbi:hypothetical protein ANMWB30_23930 [Arthrobacter sp. MWB30]|nr:hypothetical protein ANMWB30_23930 [Arthrobacter sp. MWB30]